MTTLLLIRHAAHDLLGHTLAGRMPGVRLSAAGSAQAERLARRLALAPLAAVYSSPLERAVGTAIPVARRHGLEVAVADGLGELDFGEWTGRGFAALDGLPRWRLFNTFRAGTRPPGGELMLEAQARVVTELERLHGEHPVEVVVVVTHGDLIKAAIAHYAGIHLDLFGRIEISPASVSIVAVSPHGPRILRLNDTGALPSLSEHANR